MKNTSPTFIYGTAWKKDRTEELVTLALSAGFRAFDTANQPKHYNEPGMGDALKKYFAKGNSRDSLWIQTKFTPVDGHDDRIPYNPKAPIAEQVRQSFAKSLEHLGVDYLDSYLLHGPYHHPGLGREDWEVWKALEEIQRSGKAKQIGISNVNSLQLEMLIQEGEIQPACVQNRCYANRGWDSEVRALCRENQIHYQGFSLLTANMQVLESELLQEISQEAKIHPIQAVFRFAQQVGMTPLTGTSRLEHMKLDLASEHFTLSQAALQKLEEAYLHSPY